MTLVWGSMARLLAPHGSRTTEVAAAMRTALEQGIERRPGGASVAFAPGAVPVLVFGDGHFAPFVHRFELTTVISGGDGLKLDGASTLLGEYPRFAAESPLGGSRTELSTYLGTLRAAGLLDACAHWVVGPAYAPEFEQYRLIQEPNVEALVEHVRAHPFAPTVAVRPDDLARVP